MLACSWCATQGRPGLPISADTSPIPPGNRCALVFAAHRGAPRPPDPAIPGTYDAPVDRKRRSALGPASGRFSGGSLPNLDGSTSRCNWLFSSPSRYGQLPFTTPSSKSSQSREGARGRTPVPPSAPARCSTTPRPPAYRHAMMGTGQRGGTRVLARLFERAEPLTRPNSHSTTAPESQHNCEMQPTTRRPRGVQFRGVGFDLRDFAMQSQGALRHRHAPIIGARVSKY